MPPPFDPLDLECDDGPLDTRVRLVTPERIVFEYPLAGPFPRFCAYLIDQVCVLLIFLASVVALLVLSLGSESSVGLMLVVYFLLSWGYGAFMEGVFNGRTIGKSLTGLRVVTARGVPVSGVQAIVRNVVGAFDGLIPGVYLPGLASMFLTRKFQRLGDLAAGTMVVREERRGRLAIIQVHEPAARALIARLPVRLAAGPRLTRALSDYVGHRQRFGEARRAEMAEPLARPLRAWLGIGDDVSADVVLCAVYHRVLVGE
jgi:uncharacterized RDD family membrane protein YckC